MNRIQQKKLKLSHENQTKNKVSIKPMKLNVLIGIKHFTQMIMMMHLAIHTTVVPSPSDEISCEIFSGNMQKKKNRKISTKRKEMESKGRKNIIKEKDETTKERMGNLHIHKNRYYHQSKAPVKRIQSTFSSVITKKRKKIFLFTDRILKNLRMGEFNCFIKKGESSLKAFPGEKQDN